MPQGYKMFQSIFRDANRRLREREQKMENMRTNESEIIEPFSNGEGENMLMDDNWFKRNPTKILGEVVPTTDRFGKAITKVKGTLENAVYGIDAATVILPQKLEERKIIESDVKQDLEVLLNDKVHLKNAEAVVREAKKYLAKKELSRVMEEPAEPEKSMLEFDEILQKYNPGISEEEIKVWLWYKRESDGVNDETILFKGGWKKYLVAPNKINEFIPKWLEQGIVCSYKGSYLPSVLYYAENIYERLRVLKADEKNMSPAQALRQREGLEKVLPKKLTLSDPIKENRLIIKPVSDFASEVMIRTLSDGTKFHDYKNGQSVDISKNLKDAYKHWLRNLPKDAFKKSTDLEIINYYLEERVPARYYDKDVKMRMKQNAKKEGDELFVEFLFSGISREDQLGVEQHWNEKYNGYVDINYFKIPVAFSCSSTFKNKPLFIRQAQREGIGFISVHGSGCIAYDVGVGKTMTAILSIANALEMGQCKRPFIIVPNQTYSNWLGELRGVLQNNTVTLSGILPQYPINDLYNLSKEHIDTLGYEGGEVLPVADYSITLMTYEGFNRLCFDDETWNKIGVQLFEILNQGTEEEREKVKLYERVEEIMGRGMQGGMVQVEQLGLDFMVVDEAHAMKKSFTKVRGSQKLNGDYGKSPYDIHSGDPSMIALRGFMMSQYILRNNYMRNVVLLTATPFTNSPLEIYSMLALIGYQELEKSGVKNIKEFFDVFIKTSLELVINSKLKPERKEVVMGFSNLIALQSLIFRYISYKSGEDAGIQRPNKIVLPMLSERVGDEMKALPADRQISTNISMTTQQKDFMRDVEMYVMGKTSLVHFCANSEGQEDVSEENIGPGVSPVDERNMSADEEDSARTLRGLSFARQLALSPYLYGCNPDKNPTYEQYVENSPKIDYVMGCIKSVRDFHMQKGEEVSGQVIYMNSGVSFFPLLKEYLVKRVGFKENEIGIISSGISAAKKDSIKEKFLAGSVKVIIGSASIKEGINLQDRASTLYDLWIDWNPTDIKQLEGRIWRYGNRYANVRIVIPLMENSIDSFIFQKLQEKTSRINEIWYRSGKVNALNLEEFNPAELKAGLITDPYALAELLLLEQRENILDEIKGLESQVVMMEEITRAKETFNKQIGELKNIVENYRPQKIQDIDGKAIKVEPRTTDGYLRIFKEYLDDANTTKSWKEEIQYTEVKGAHTTVKRGLEQILQPRGYDINFDAQKVVGRIKDDIEVKKQLLEEKTGEEAVMEKAKEIAKEKEQRKTHLSTVRERVREFATLNEKVLTELMVYGGDSGKEQVKRETHQKKGEVLENADSKLDKIRKLREAFLKMQQNLERIEKLKSELMGVQ